MVALRVELNASFDRRMEEKEARIHQLNEELNGVRQKVSVQPLPPNVFILYHVSKMNSSPEVNVSN